MDSGQMRKFHGLVVPDDANLYLFCRLLGLGRNNPWEGPLANLLVITTYECVGGQKLTLNICNALLEDLLKGLGAFELLLDLGNDALSKLLLLTLLDLALVADPGVEDRLGLSSESSLLLELESLGLEPGGFLLQTM